MPQEVTIDNQSYLAPTWQDMGEMTVQLADKIAQSGNTYDRAIALARGGLGWAKHLQDLLRIQNISSFQIKLYTGIAETNKEPEIVQPLPVSIAGERILLFDDVADTGKTFEFAVPYLREQRAASIQTAVHYTKPHSVVVPNFFVEEITSWVIFPHDTVEMIDLFKKKWKGVDEVEFRSRLEKIGIASSIIDSTFQKGLY